MWLQQKDYFFSIIRDSVTQDDNLSNIHLKVNNQLTTVKLEQLFLKISSHEFSQDGKGLMVRGWSILEKINSTESLKDINISFYAEDLGDLTLVKMTNPWCQMNDKEISEENFSEITNKIIELSTVSEESVADSEEKVDEQAEELEKPSVVIINNKTYEKGKQPWLKSGYKEYEFENFRLLAKPDKSFLIELINSDEIKQFKDPNILAEGFYQFNDVDNNRKINAKVIDEKLSIEFIANDEKIEDKIDLDEIELPEYKKEIESTSQS